MSEETDTLKRQLRDANAEIWRLSAYIVAHNIATGVHRSSVGEWGADAATASMADHINAAPGARSDVAGSDGGNFGLPD